METGASIAALPAAALPEAKLAKKICKIPWNIFIFQPMVICT
jgi:hypothetical protein